MPDHVKRFESMLFNYETTGRTDFRDGEIHPPIKTVYKEKKSCLRVRPPQLKDIHTLIDWNKPIVPFTLYHKPKDVVRTNPRTVQQTFLKPEDHEREQVQKTRPRLVMTPSVSMDDIEDSRTRNLLIRDVYSTTTQSAMEDALALANYKTVRAPFPGLPAPANPITLPKLQPSYVSPEWRMDSITWDNRQLRSHSDPTKEFWLAKHTKCTACDATAEREARKRWSDK